MMERHQRAESLHQAHINDVVKKASDENLKVDEVVFIQTLDTENRKLSLQQRLDDAEERRQALLKATLEKQKESDSAVAEAAERRKALEEERQRKLAEEQRRKEEQQAKLEERRAAAEREAAAKRQERERRLEERRAETERDQARAASLEERLKEAAVRRMAHLEQIKERAAVSKDGGRDALVSPSSSISSANLRAGLDSPPRASASTPSAPDSPSRRAADLAQSQKDDAVAKRLKKRAKKLRQRLAGAAKPIELSVAGSDRARAQRALDEFTRVRDKGGPTALEGAAADLLRWLQAERDEGRLAACAVGVQGALVDAVVDAFTSPSGTPTARARLPLLGALMHSLSTPAVREAAAGANAHAALVPVLMTALGETCNGEPGDPAPGSDVELLLRSAALALMVGSDATEHTRAMADDLGELFVASGAVASVRALFSLFDSPKGSAAPAQLPGVVGAALEFITELAERQAASPGSAPRRDAAACSPATESLLEALRSTSFAGLPSLLTATLLHAENAGGGGPHTPAAVKEALPPNFIATATSVLRALNTVARVDLTTLQAMLSAPDLKVETYHLLAFLVSFCTDQWGSRLEGLQTLLNESVLLIGHFALLQPANQDVLRWGKSPTLLQRLGDLPFPYFSDPKLMPVLFPTLVAVCFSHDRNKEVLERELSLEFVATFVRDERNKAAAAGEGEAGPGALPDPRFSFAARFPASLWPDAQEFFQ